MNFKFYTYGTKSERIPIGDVEGHNISLTARGFFYLFEDEQVATASNVSMADTRAIRKIFPWISSMEARICSGSTLLLGN